MGKSKSKGDRFELDTVEWAIKAGDEIDRQYYSPTEGGRLGSAYNGLGFDIATVKYSIECKHRSSVPKWLIGAWQQVIEVNAKECKQHKFDKSPMMAVKKNYKPIMHIITPERHKELLEYERKCKSE